jgi:hypothetical protein
LPGIRLTGIDGRNGRGGPPIAHLPARSAIVQHLQPETADLLKRRAHKLASKGELRKAALALRERAALVGDAASWVMAGAMLRRARRDEEAIAALRHGMWLHERAGASARARSVAKLLGELDPQDRLAQRILKRVA